MADLSLKKIVAAACSMILNEEVTIDSIEDGKNLVSNTK